MADLLRRPSVCGVRVTRVVAGDILLGVVLGLGPTNHTARRGTTVDRCSALAISWT